MDTPKRTAPRYQVGCAGQFALAADGTGHLHNRTDDQDEAIASCETGPIGCEVYDTVTQRWIGPTCREEIDEAKARIAARAAAERIRVPGVRTIVLERSGDLLVVADGVTPEAERHVLYEVAPDVWRESPCAETFPG